VALARLAQSRALKLDVAPRASLRACTELRLARRQAAGHARADSARALQRWL